MAVQSWRNHNLKYNRSSRRKTIFTKGEMKEMKHAEYLEKLTSMLNETETDSIYELMQKFSLRSFIADSDQIMMVEK